MESVVQWLRPFVDSKAWDYCVVWKFADDPSRFIEWLGCCCSGGVGNYDYVKVKEESGEEEQKLTAPFCRDAYLKHPVRTKACEALAQCPSFIALYSGIHGEVVITNQPKWLTYANSSDPNASHEPFATRVLIPIFGGLVELFVRKHIPEDQKIIELVLAHCNAFIEQKIVPAGSCGNVGLDKQYLDSLPERNFQNFLSPLQLLTFIPKIQVISSVPQFDTHPNCMGSSSGSNPCIDHPSLDSNYSFISQNVPLEQSIGKPSGRKRPNYINCVLKEEIGSVLDCNKNEIGKDNKGGNQRPGKEKNRSKNLIIERNRRNRIKDGLFALRALVPKISKMDKAAILGDAADYIKELQQEVEKLKDEMKEDEEEDCKKNNADMKSSKLEEINEGPESLPPTEHNESSPGCSEKAKTEVQVEVNLIEKKDFLIKLFYGHKRGGFVRLLEALHSLELQVTDANITTFEGKVLNILRVETHKENIQPKELRESLIRLTG